MYLNIRLFNSRTIFEIEVTFSWFKFYGVKLNIGLDQIRFELNKVRGFVVSKHRHPYSYSCN
jgi:hypothetical protein